MLKSCLLICYINISVKPFLGGVIVAFPAVFLLFLGSIFLRNKKYCIENQEKEKNILSVRKKIVSLHPISKETQGVLAQVARAFDWQSKGHRFDSDILHQRRGSLQRPFFLSKGVLAHLVEHLVRNQKVTGSTPVYSTE